MSISMETKNLYITIVDDGSSEDYNEIIELFQKFFPIRLIKLEKNSGPGIARNAGLKAALHDYVAFLDCGDTYTHPLMLQRQVDFAYENPHFNMIVWSHTDKNNTIGPENNRLHGKLYKREFLVQHQLSFSTECPRVNEDVGFNIACRIINTHLSRLDDTPHIYLDSEPAVDWNDFDTSIVRSNDCEFYYNQQNMGLAKNIEHVIQLCKLNNVEEDLIAHEVYTSLAYEYLCYLSTCNRRPEFIQNALDGARYYYTKVFLPYAQFDLEDLKNTYYHVLSTFLNDEADPLHDKMIIFDLPGFLNQLQTNLWEDENLTKN